MALQKVHSPSKPSYRTDGTDQLVQVVPDPGQVGERADGHQAAQSEVEQLVAEKWDEPSVTVLRKRNKEDPT